LAVRAAVGKTPHGSAGRAASRLRNTGLTLWHSAKTSAKSPAPLRRSDAS
jgi:hypothetical protein